MKRNGFWRASACSTALPALVWCATMGCVVEPACAFDPADPGTGDVAFMIDATGEGKPISPLIYGINGHVRPEGIGGIRLGGNRWTGYNWETNNSNAGHDYFHFNDGFLVDSQPNTPPGQALAPTLQEAAGLSVATIATVPIAGFVSADDNRTVEPSETAPSARWHRVEAKKQTITSEPLSLTPDENDGFVFTDEFVNWVETNRQSNQQVMYTLDNEPGLWDDTHPRLFGATNPTFSEYRQRAIAHASAIKDVAPDAKVLGGVTFGWSAMENLHGASDFETQVPQPRSNDGLHFNRWLLQEMAAEEAAQGRVLMDLLDLHWYPEARGSDVRITAEGALNNSPDVVAARVQAPRSLWDASYSETSWITQHKTGGQGIELLNRVQADIDELKPGTLISISEYNYGGGNHISGAIAQADVLGIYGREGVHNANWWQIEGDNDVEFLKAGFESFTNFDNAGGRFGDLSLIAVTDDNAQSAIYASHSTTAADEMILVAINRTEAPLDAAIRISDDQQYVAAEIYQLTASAAEPTFAGRVSIDLLNAFLYEMPAMSVSTIRLLAVPLAGDFDGDGAVGTTDYALWRETLGQTGDGLPADGNRDGAVDAADYNLWRANFGAAIPSAVSATPTPGSLALLLVVLAFSGVVRSKR